jgi:hypothetical protein
VFESVKQHVTRPPGQYCEEYYVEQLSGDSAMIYIENGQAVFPFSEYAMCVRLASAVGRFSESAPKSTICTGNQFVEIVSGWQDASAQSGGGIGGGGIAGIAVGSVAGVAVVAIVAFCIGKKCTRTFLPINELQSAETAVYIGSGEF